VLNVQLPEIGAQRVVAPVARRPGPRIFWMLFAIEAALIAGVFALVVLFLLPSRAPLAHNADYTLVREAIWARLNGSVPDPLIEVAPGLTARSSNLRGFNLNGRTYYYYIEGRRGFDPLSRGVVDASAIEIVLRDDDGPQPLVVYRLHHP
jgi:hypothetical protein